jgi:hypothetical protein
VLQDLLLFAPLACAERRLLEHDLTVNHRDVSPYPVTFNWSRVAVPPWANAKLVIASDAMNARMEKA